MIEIASKPRASERRETKTARRFMSICSIGRGRVQGWRPSSSWAQYRRRSNLILDETRRDCLCLRRMQFQLDQSRSDRVGSTRIGSGRIGLYRIGSGLHQLHEFETSNLYNSICVRPALFFRPSARLLNGSIKVDCLQAAHKSSH